MSESTADMSGPRGDTPIVDVWSRTSRRYRRRSVLMLLVLAMLFAGLCCFTFWLRTGVYWPWMSEDYTETLARSFRPTGGDQITLSDFLSTPISVTDVWAHGIIMGLLLASLSSIPLLVAILYRFPFSIAFAVMVMFLAAMPWLGITILGGCALASLPPFKFSFRYASALIGLIPIAVYFVSASWEPAASGPRLTQHQALLYAPWVLALLGSCIICALALAIARLIDYRPGGIPPVLAMLFAVPVFLFHSHVGSDELAYRLLEQQIGPGSRVMFTTVDVGAEAGREATRRWSQSRNASYDVIHRRMLEKAVANVLKQCEADRERAAARCDAFIARFPGSRHIQNVLFLKGRAQDQRIQRNRLVEDHRAEFRSDVPNRASRRTWETLVERFPHALLSATGLYKLAILDAREGGEGIDMAIDRLETLVEQFDAARSASQPSVPSEPESASMFRKAPVSSGLGMDRAVVVRRARRLREILTACRDDRPKAFGTLFGPGSGRTDALVHPIELLLWLDETHPQYKMNLEEIARHFSESRTRGYVEIRLARMERAFTRRIMRFEAAAASLSDAGQPAGAAAYFYLGDLLQEDARPDDAKFAFDTLTKKYPESCWAHEARERLSSLTMLEATAE